MRLPQSFTLSRCPLHSYEQDVDGCACSPQTQLFGGTFIIPSSPHSHPSLFCTLSFPFSLLRPEHLELLVLPSSPLISTSISSVLPGLISPSNAPLRARAPNLTNTHQSKAIACCCCF